MPPSGSDSKIGGAPVHRRRHGDGFEVGAGVALCDADHRRFGVEQRRHLTTERGGVFQRITRGGQRHAGPVLLQGTGVFEAIGRGVQDSEGVVEAGFCTLFEGNYPHPPTPSPLHG